MYLIFFLIGMVVAFAGALLVLYAVPVVDVAAAALFTSGIFAIVGALILMALAAVARSISRIAERLEVQPLAAPALPPVATIAREELPPRPARVEPAPAAPAPPIAKKTSLLSAWLNRASPASSEKPASAEQKAAQPAEEPTAEQGDLTPPTTAPEEPRVPARPTSAPPTFAPPTFAPAPMEPTVAVPPIAAAPPSSSVPAAPPPQAVPPAPAAGPAIPHAVAPASRPAPRSQPAAGTPEATVYKSGVIDGMAYTLFMDGAIEAELPQGRVRFASVDELQKYLTNRP
jgi:hypothetical protein